MFKIVEFSHLLIKEYLEKHHNKFINCLDATCGLGNDTIFMAKLLSDKGHVDSYDIQLQAINETLKKIFDCNNDFELFKKMISVSGIGPKGALAILSALPFEDLVFAIISGDAKSISKAQGIGAKTAQRLILELKDKLSAESVSAVVSEVNETSVVTHTAKQEAIEACVALGYSYPEAARALKEIKDDSLTTEEYVKIALKKLF